MKTSLKNTFITATSFLLFHLLWFHYLADIRTFFDGHIHNLPISHMLGFVVIGIPTYIAVIVMNGYEHFFSSLGLNRACLKGCLFAFIVTLPMLIGYASINDFNSNFNWDKFIRWGITAAIVEEVFYRGFLFGQIFRKTKFGFVLSILGSSILFALSHAHQTPDIGRLIGIFITTGIASILFAWVYVEWNYNLWASIFLHLFMNIWWILFPAMENTDALGNISLNIFRIISVVLVVAVTIVYKRKKGEAMIINKHTLWMRR